MGQVPSRPPPGAPPKTLGPCPWALFRPWALSQILVPVPWPCPGPWSRPWSLAGPESTPWPHGPIVPYERSWAHLGGPWALMVLWSKLGNWARPKLGPAPNLGWAQISAGATLGSQFSLGKTRFCLGMVSRLKFSRFHGSKNRSPGI